MGKFQKKTPEQNKNLVAWTKDKGLSQARRSKEGKWTLSNHDGTWTMKASGGAK